MRYKLQCFKLDNIRHSTGIPPNFFLPTPQHFFKPTILLHFQQLRKNFGRAKRCPIALKQRKSDEQFHMSKWHLKLCKISSWDVWGNNLFTVLQDIASMLDHWLTKQNGQVAAENLYTDMLNQNFQRHFSITTPLEHKTYWQWLRIWYMDHIKTKSNIFHRVEWTSCCSCLSLAPEVMSLLESTFTQSFLV